MARYPGATWQPLAANWADQPKMRAFDIVCIHTMVGGLAGTDSLFRVVNGPGFVGTESHFGTGADGAVVQWQDTAYQAEANYNGNGHIISIENADWGKPFPTWSSSDVPAFTDAQIEAVARICAWAHLTHDIPLVLIPDSKPGRRGIAPHRWGVPGYVVPGGELWSTVRGKACPGDRRIAQLPQIIARARQIAEGGNPPEDDMPLSQEDLDAINSVAYSAVQAALRDQTDANGRNLYELGNQLRADVYVAAGKSSEDLAEVLRPVMLAAAASAASAVAARGGGVTEDEARQIAVDAVAAKLSGS